VTTLRHAARALARTPVFTAVAVLSLALGFGANTAIASIVRQLLLRPLPVSHAERLVNLVDPGPRGDGDVSCGDAGTCDAVFSRAMVRDIERAAAARPGVAAVAAHAAFGASLAARGQTTRASGVLVSGGYFATLGVAPALGRLLGPDDDRVGAAPAAVVSHAYWTARLGADPAAVGRPVVVNGRPFTLVGVAAPGFTGTTVDSRAELFVPLAFGQELGVGYPADDRRAHWVYAFARLAPGATVADAARALNAGYRPVVRDVEAPAQSQMSAAERARFLGRALVLEPGARGQSRLHEDGRAPLALLALTAAVVLLIACANVANLLLVRGAARAGELALRRSLGATPRRLVALLLAEAVLLAAAGGAAGLLVAGATLRGIVALVPPNLADVVGASLDGRMLALSAALALGTGVVFGLFPALHASRAAPAGVMRGAAGPGGRRPARRGPGPRDARRRADRAGDGAARHGRAVRAEPREPEQRAARSRRRTRRHVRRGARAQRLRRHPRGRAVRAARARPRRAAGCVGGDHRRGRSPARRRVGQQRARRGVPPGTRRERRRRTATSSARASSGR
jgi:predicted permease